MLGKRQDDSVIEGAHHETQVAAAAATYGDIVIAAGMVERAQLMRWMAEADVVINTSLSEGIMASRGNEGLSRRRDVGRHP